MKAHQITSQKKGRAPSAISSTRQFHRPKIHPERGEETITAMGRQSIQ